MEKQKVYYCTECHCDAGRYCFREHPYAIEEYEFDTTDLEWAN